MKTYYLISEHTKEHIRWTPDMPMSAPGYKTVEADSEGWVPHTGNVCPLPDDVLCDIRCADGSTSNYSHKARQWGWLTSGEMCDITHYKPILEPEKMQEPEPIPAPQYDPRSVSFNLLDRLKAAHEHAQTIPDLEAELREVLAGMGYDLVARSPFVEPDTRFVANMITGTMRFNVRDMGKTEPAEDMTDWRNWREGDVLTCVRPFTGYLSEGENYVVSEDVTGDYVGIILQGDSTISSFRPDRFRFHSRPAKGVR